MKARIALVILIVIAVVLGMTHFALYSIREKKNAWVNDAKKIHSALFTYEASGNAAGLSNLFYSSSNAQVFLSKLPGLEIQRKDVWMISSGILGGAEESELVLFTPESAPFHFGITLSGSGYMLYSREELEQMIGQIPSERLVLSPEGRNKAGFY